ncbi:hypothetical protein RJT34_06798 [Clitoria ternatea]|uniref:Uncharacterized protein n=1 Tax=Clitoria ternatea TaxID=43366 RepID=A0AAN9K568_CLITE
MWWVVVLVGGCRLMMLWCGVWLCEILVLLCSPLLTLGKMLAFLETMTGVDCRGLDHTAAVDVFEPVRSRNGLIVGIVLKPFRFEGIRRQEEVSSTL